MQVEEAIALQRKLEEDIKLLIRNYTSNTGLLVRNIDIVRGGYIVYRSDDPITVRCTVETP